MEKLTTLTIYKDDHQKLEQLRIKHSFVLGKVVLVRDFIRHMIGIYEKKRR